MRVSFPPLLRATLLLACGVGEGNPGLRGADEDQLQQVLVFDAGSSGTRVHVFNLVCSPGNPVPTIDLSVRAKQTLKLKPGLSHFAKSGDKAGAQRNIRSLLDFADTLVPQERRPRTPALLKATAGLRAVPFAQAEVVLKEVRAALADSGYRFEEDWAGIIPGKEEAGLAWVAANYLAGTFSSPSTGQIASLGVIEMGGGSTQVTFQVENARALAADDTYNFVDLQGHTYRVYAHSYQGFGQDYAQAQLRQALEGAGKSEDPCYPVGYERMPANTSFSVNRGITQKPVRGVGSAGGCQEAIFAYVFAHRAGDAPGSYSHEPALVGRFVATENFVHVRKRLSLSMAGDERSIASAAEAACGVTHAPVAGTSDPSLPNECFGLSFQSAFLKALKVLGFPGVELQVAGQVGGSDLDWAIGAALVHSVRQQLAAPQAEPLFDLAGVWTGKTPFGLEAPWAPLFAGLGLLAVLGPLAARCAIARRAAARPHVQWASEKAV